MRTDHEFVTTLVIRHRAGSEEGAVYQRNRWGKEIHKDGAEVVMAGTRAGNASEAAMQAFFNHPDPEE